MSETPAFGSEARLAAIAGAEMGPLLWIAGRGADSLDAVRACASRVDFVGAARGAGARVAELRAAGLSVRRQTPATFMAAASRSDRAIAVVDEVPEGIECAALLDRVLGRLAHDGLLALDLPASAIREHRLLTILAGTCRDLAPAPWRLTGRLAFTARREAPGRSLETVLHPPAELAAVLYLDGAAEPQEICAELLFRQNRPFSTLLLVDDQPATARGLPADLWGMAPHSLTQPAILRTGGIGYRPALREALRSLDEAFVLLVDGSVRPLPNLAATLDAVRGEGVDLVAVDALREGTDGAFRRLEPRPGKRGLAPALEEGHLLSGAAALSRTALIAALGGRGAAVRGPTELLRRVLHRGRSLVVPFPLALAVDRPRT